MPLDEGRYTVGGSISEDETNSFSSKSSNDTVAHQAYRSHQRTDGTSLLQRAVSTKHREKPYALDLFTPLQKLLSKRNNMKKPLYHIGMPQI